MTRQHAKFQPPAAVPATLDEALATLEAAVARLERVADRLEARFGPGAEEPPGS